MLLRDCQGRARHGCAIGFAQPASQCRVVASSAVSRFGGFPALWHPLNADDTALPTLTGLETLDWRRIRCCPFGSGLFSSPTKPKRRNCFGKLGSRLPHPCVRHLSSKFAEGPALDVPRQKKSSLAPFRPRAALISTTSGPVLHTESQSAVAVL